MAISHDNLLSDASTHPPGDASKRDDVPRCLGCGYIVWGLSKDRCPECGHRHRPHRASPARHRHGRADEQHHRLPGRSARPGMRLGQQAIRGGIRQWRRGGVVLTGAWTFLHGLPGLDPGHPNVATRDIVASYVASFAFFSARRRNAASMNGSKSPSSTFCGLPTSTPVRRSFTRGSSRT